MNIMFIFNIGFDIAVVALILFAGWFYANIRSTRKAFKWLAFSVLAIVLSTLIIGYGGTKSAQDASQASQDQYEIRTLNQRIKDLKGGDSSESATSPAEESHGKRLRVVNQNDTNQVKSQIANHHHMKVNLVAKVASTQGTHILARGVHSSQQFVINLSHTPQVSKGEYIVSLGHATSLKNISGQPTIEIKASSAKKQPGSPSPQQ